MKRVANDIELQRELGEYAEADAIIWSYSASHSTLVIRLTSAGHRGNLHIVCEGCRSIRAPTLWTPAALHLTGVRPDLSLIAEHAGLTVHCSDVHLDRDVPPVY